MEWTNGPAVRWLGSILVTSGITFYAWAGPNLARQSENWDWVAYPGAFLSMPGVFVAVFLAAIFSPQGFHGADDFDWIIAPSNFVFYFVLSFLVFRRISRKKNSLPGQTPAGNIDANGYAARWRAK